MKYCPYCGADLIDNKGSFCPECGKPLPEKEKPMAEGKNGRHIKKSVHKSSGSHTKSRVAYTEEKSDDAYDGYYDDILPDDDGAVRQALDKAIIKKVALLIVGLLIVVGACVAIMYLV